VCWELLSIPYSLATVESLVTEEELGGVRVNVVPAEVFPLQACHGRSRLASAHGLRMRMQTLWSLHDACFNCFDGQVKAAPDAVEPVEGVTVPSDHKRTIRA